LLGSTRRIRKTNGKAKRIVARNNKQNVHSDDSSQGSKSNDDDGESCPHCGRTGHDPDACWMLKKNKKKCPDWFDPEKYSTKGKKNNRNGHHNSEVRAVGRSGRGSGVELLLSSMSFPNSLKLLENPNIWIANTGATCNITPTKLEQAT
jgi:hypothetical protein